MHKEAAIGCCRVCEARACRVSGIFGLYLKSGACVWGRGGASCQSGTLMNIRTLLVFTLMFLASLESYGKGGTNQVIFAAAAQGDVPLLKQIFATNLNASALCSELLRTAVMNGRKDAVEFLISKGGGVNDKGFFDMEPLANMAMYSNADDGNCAAVATVLLAHGAELDPVDQYGATPLFHAVELNKIKLTRVLLEHGADPAITRKNSYYTPLHMAVRGHHMEMAKLLLDFKAPTDIKDPDGNLPMLVWAIQMQNHELAQLLIEHGAPNTPPRTAPPQSANSMNMSQVEPAQQFNQREVPMLMALRFRDTQTLALLLRSNALVNAVDENGDTALHWATRLRDINMIKMLLDAGARVDATNYGGATPLLIAQAEECQPVIEMLRQAAAARGVVVEEVAAPSSEDMRAIARRICSGDPAALDELDSLTRKLYSGNWRQKERIGLNAARMHAAFGLLGEEAGKGNTNAFQALKKCLERGGFLKSFAPDGLGIAAAAGSDDSLNLLLRFRDWKLLENEAAFALAAPAKANKQPAVDFFVALAEDPESARHQYYGVGWLVKEVLQTSVTNGSPGAKEALDKFLAASSN